MEPQFQEIVDAINKGLDERFGTFEEKTDERFGTFEKKIIKDIDEHVAEQLGKAVDELKHQAKLNAEEMRSQVKKLADGYGMNLDRIERELKDLNSKFDTKFGEHDRIFTNHNQRITVLEKQQ